jgi:hypothetical protein
MPPEDLLPANGALVGCANEAKSNRGFGRLSKVKRFEVAADNAINGTKRLTTFRFGEFTGLHMYERKIRTACYTESCLKSFEPEQANP